MMRHRNVNEIVLVCLLITILGCLKNATGTYTYIPMDNITYTLHTKELKYHSDVKAVFLNFDLLIENKSNEKVFLDIGKIRGNLNGQPSSAVYYDSLASVMPEIENLKSGLTQKNLYFVFPESLRGRKLRDFKITSYGLSIK